MPLVPITDAIAYLPGANNLAVIAVGGGGAIAVDTGIDKDAGRALRKALDEAGLTLRAIVSTHHHADHVGGNAFLLRQYPDVRVYAPPLEAALIRHPILEAVYLSGGAAPPAAMRSKFVLAPGSPVHHELGAAPLAAGATLPAEVAGVALTLVGLPGHSPAQVGVLADDVLIAADGFFGPGVLAKHGVPYTHDVAGQLASLDALEAVAAAWFLPGHGALAARDELGGQLEANRAAVRRSSELTLGALAEPGDLAAVTARVLAALDQHVGGVAQLAVFSGAVAAHLTYLEQQGAARLAVEGGRAIWSPA